MTMLPTCRTLVSSLTDHEEGEGDWLTRAGVHLHLSLCEECSRYVGQARMVRAALSGLAGAAVSPGTEALLMQRFRAWRADRTRVATAAVPKAPR